MARQAFVDPMYRQTKAFLDRFDKDIDLLRLKTNAAVHIKWIATDNRLDATLLNHRFNMLQPGFFRSGHSGRKRHSNPNLVCIRKTDPFLAPIYAQIVQTRITSNASVLPSPQSPVPVT